MEHLLLTRRQILKAAGAAGVVSAASLVLGPIGFFAEEDEHALGPFGPWDPPEPILELSSRFDDFHPAISNDELNLYFSSNRPWVADTTPDHNHIWVSTRRHRHAPWGKPVVLAGPMNVPNINSIAPNLSPDQLTLYFGGRLPHTLGFGDIWLVRRDDADDDGGWGGLTNLGPGVNTSHGENAPSYFVEPGTGIEHLYFTRNPDPGPIDETDDIYDSVRDASSGRFVAFKTPLFSVQDLPKARNTRTAVRRDALELLITSNRPRVDGAVEAKIERLWVSTRLDTAAVWGKPGLANNGAPDALDGINSGQGDGGPALSRNGKTLYFFSQRAASGTPGKRQLWTSRRERLDDSDDQEIV